MTGGSLFSGIGGFELGLLRSGLITEVKWQVEIDGYCRQILERHFPDTKRYGDIRELHGAITHAESARGRGILQRERGKEEIRIKGCDTTRNTNEAICPSCLEPVDVIFGGFPCQPFSVAGKRQGSEDDRYLWPEMVRIIAEIRPALVIGENVSGIVNMALDQVLFDLEAEGYETATFVIPACAVNAPHRRDRVWIVAYSERNYDRRPDRFLWGKREQKEIQQDVGNAPDSHIQGLQGKPDNIGGKGAQSHDKQFMRCDRGWEENWLEVATRFCRMDDGVSNRVDRLKALGNAVVPQVAEAIGTIIKEWLDNVSI